MIVYSMRSSLLFYQVNGESDARSVFAKSSVPPGRACKLNRRHFSLGNLTHADARWDSEVPLSQIARKA